MYERNQGYIKKPTYLLHQLNKLRTTSKSTAHAVIKLGLIAFPTATTVLMSPVDLKDERVRITP